MTSAVFIASSRKKGSGSQVITFLNVKLIRSPTGIGVRTCRTVDDDDTRISGCTTNNHLDPAVNGVDGLSLSGQSGHLDCFVQLFDKKNEYINREKVIENNGNAMTALTAQPSNDSGGEKRLSQREARLLSLNLRHECKNGYVAMPDPNDLSVWRVGKNVNGSIRLFPQSGTREWAVAECRRNDT